MGPSDIETWRETLGLCGEWGENWAFLPNFETAAFRENRREMPEKLYENQWL